MSQLLPQDILIAVRLLKIEPKWTFESLSRDIEISASQCHLAFGRLLNSRLLDANQRVAIKGNLLELLVHGVKYIFPPRLETHPKPIVGLPTAHSAPDMRHLIAPSGQTFVWSHPKGTEKSVTEVVPLYKTVPAAASKYDHIYRILAVVDSIRLGHARERDEAASVLKRLVYDPP